LLVLVNVFTDESAVHDLPVRNDNDIVKTVAALGLGFMDALAFSAGLRLKEEVLALLAFDALLTD